LNAQFMLEAPAQRGKPLPCLPARGRMRPGRQHRLPVAPPPLCGPRKVAVVDSFAGGGGASNGIELALEILSRMGLLPAGHDTLVHYAINHDEPALAMHEANHPRTKHLPHNVWKVSLREILGDNFFGLLWLSPDCRDHSPAKGGPITSRSVRDLAWVLVRWLKELPDWQRPWCIFLENVPAFSKWSPLVERADGKGYERDRSREGEIFHRFVRTVCKQFGYSAGWHEEMSCRHGDPTIRKRLYLVFRRDGERVEFPDQTHGDPKSEAVKCGKLKPWPVAADIIDFSLDCPSIFMTKAEARDYTRRTGKRLIRPLAFKTDARLAKGVKRHVIDAGDEAFVATCNHAGDGFRGQPLGEPFATVARARDAHGLVLPHVAVFRGDSDGRPVTAPAPTATANSFIKRPGGASPLGVVETSAVPFVSRGQHGGGNRPAGEPLHTIAASDGDTNQIAQAVIAPFVAVQNNDTKPDGAQYHRAGRAVTQPLGAATTSPTHSLAVPYLVPRYGEREGQEPRSLPIDRPMPTPVPDGNQGSLAAVYLAQHNTGEEGHSAGRPVSTIVQKGCTQGVVAASIVEMHGRSDARPAGDPLSAATGTSAHGLMAAHMLSLKGSDRRDGPCTDAHDSICAGGQHSAVVTLPLVTAYFGQSVASPADEPLGVAGTKDRFAATQVEAAVPPLSERQLARARQVAEFLRFHGCWDGGDFVTVIIRGVTFIIVDIGMRMLTPRELARAQSFPDSYVLDPIVNGKRLSETEQRHKIGNSVTRFTAAAHIVANYRPPLSWGEQEYREAA